MLVDVNLKQIVAERMIGYDKNLIGEMSVDVRLGNKFWFEPSTKVNNIVELAFVDKANIGLLTEINSEFYDLQPGKFVKAITQELFLPNKNSIGVFSLCSKLAQNGLNQATSIFIRPSWPKVDKPEPLVLELTNDLEFSTWRLSAGSVIGQISFIPVSDYVLKKLL